MSLVKSKAIQLGFDATPTNNFLIYQPLTPDGTFRIANGNQGATTDIMTVTSGGSVTFAGTTNFSSLNFGSGSQSAPSLFPTGDSNTGIWFPAADTFAVSTGGTERFRISSNGNASFTGELDVKNGSPLLLLNSDNTNYYYLQNGGASGAANPYLAFVQGGVAERLRIDKDGNVSIGATSAGGYKLNVQGNLYTSGSINDFGSGLYPIARVNATANNAIFGFALDGNQSGAYNGRDWRVEQGRSSAGQFNITDITAGNVVRFNIDANGKIGIGTTSASSLLTVAGPIASGLSATSDAIYQRAQAVSGTYWTILHSGTGLTGTYPDSVTDATAGAHIRLSSGDLTNDYAGVIDISAYGKVGSTLGNYISFSRRTAANAMTESMRITSTGNVGIGSQTVSTKLQVGAAPTGTLLNYIDGTTKVFAKDQGILVTSSNSANTNIGGGIDLTNNTYSAGSYSPLLSFSSTSSNSAYSNTYAGIYGVLGGVGADANWVYGHLALATGSGAGITERVRIDSNGNVGINTTDPSYAKFNVYAPSGRSEIISGAGNGQGGANWIRIVKFVSYNSSNNKLIIPFTYQGSLNSTTICRVMGHTAEYNTSQNVKGFEVTFAVGHLTALYALTAWGGGGTYSSIATNGMNVEITLSTTYNARTEGGVTAGGMYVMLEYMTNVPNYSINVAGIALN